MKHLEVRHLLASDFCNPFNAYDVDDNGYLTPLDALHVINDIVAGGPRQLAPPGGHQAGTRH